MSFVSVVGGTIFFLSDLAHYLKAVNIILNFPSKIYDLCHHVDKRRFFFLSGGSRGKEEKFLENVCLLPKEEKKR